MASVRVYIKDSYVSANGEAPVYASIYIDREKIEIPCKVSVPISAWDPKSCKVTIRMKNHADLNLIIGNTRKRINDILVEYRLRNKLLNKDLFLRDFNNPREFKTFYDFVAWYQKLRFKEIEPATIASHEALIHKLKDFRESLVFEDIYAICLCGFVAIFVRKNHTAKINTISILERKIFKKKKKYF